MKGIAYYIVICCVIGVFISTIASVIPKFPPTARGFLYMASEGKYNDAYQLFSDNFKKNNTIEVFTQVVQANQLDQFKSVDWVRDVRVDDTHAYVMGMMTTKEDKRLGVAVYFIKVAGSHRFDQQWRIEGFEAGDKVVQKLSQ